MVQITGDIKAIWLMPSTFHADGFNSDAVPSVTQVLAESDVYVSGSHQEGFSLALLEALSMGLPAVVTYVGSAREVVLEGHTGYIVNRRDPDLFAGYVAAASAGRWEMRARCEAVAAPQSRKNLIFGFLPVLADG